MSTKAPEKQEYAIGQDPNRHYLSIEIDSPTFNESKIEEYLDRNSLAEGEEGQPMYRVEADPRKDSDARRYTGSSKRILLSCSKAAQVAWEKKWSEQATAVLRPRLEPGTSFTTFRGDDGRELAADSNLIL